MASVRQLDVKFGRKVDAECGNSARDDAEFDLLGSYAAGGTDCGASVDGYAYAYADRNAHAHADGDTRIYGDGNARNHGDCDACAYGNTNARADDE